MTIRTRFAPSPTGYLHIGGVRSALFNWLLTRREGGKFLLRIDDTDAERNRAEALQPILDGFRWLGMTWDEGPEVGGPHAPYFQSERGDLYRQATLRLIDAGHAYPCYTSKEDLDAARKAAEKAKQSYVHRGEHRNTAPAECRRLFEEKPALVRFKVPENRSVVIDDLIAGKVEVQSNLIGDPVILRIDGRPLYNFATVVDDVAMNITHVVRAKEHLSNTPIQVLIYEGLNYPLPKFAHVPVVNWRGKKMSKRDLPPLTKDERDKLHMLGWTDADIEARTDLNIATVAFYREMGYLPQALVNYLGRLGWSMDASSEFIPLETMIANFGLDRVNNAPGEFDPKKLHWLAGEYMKLLPLDEKVAGVIPFLQKAKLVGDVDDATRQKIAKVMQACGDRIQIFSDIFQYGAFFFRDPEYDPKAVDKRLRPAPETLREVRDFLASIDDHTAENLETKIKEFCETKQIKIGDMNHILRVGTTGVTVGPGVFDCLALLGRAETLRRLDMALKLVA